VCVYLFMLHCGGCPNVPTRIVKTKNFDGRKIIKKCKNANRFSVRGWFRVSG